MEKPRFGAIVFAVIFAAAVIMLLADNAIR
jgi:hypothetical protein